MTRLWWLVYGVAFRPLGESNVLLLEVVIPTLGFLASLSWGSHECEESRTQQDGSTSKW